MCHRSTTNGKRPTNEKPSTIRSRIRPYRGWCHCAAPILLDWASKCVEVSRKEFSLRRLCHKVLQLISWIEVSFIILCSTNQKAKIFHDSQLPPRFFRRQNYEHNHRFSSHRSRRCSNNIELRFTIQRSAGINWRQRNPTQKHGPTD